VTRVFSSTRDVYVYLQAYRPYGFSLYAGKRKRLTVLDPAGGKAAFWQAPMVLVP
jgi:hypothetical protein